MIRRRAGHPTWILTGALAGALSACGGAPRQIPTSSGPPVAVPSASVVEIDAAGMVRKQATTGRSPAGPPATIGAEVLDPDPDLADAVVARVAGVEVRRSHVYQAFATAKPELTEQVLDMVVGDILMARHAREFNITVPAPKIEARVDQEIEVIRKGVEAQLDGAVSYEEFLEANYALDPASFRDTIRRRQAIFALRGLVIRYLALLEGQVEVRILRHKDRALVEEARRKAAAGAEFAKMARRLSQDPSRVDGGRLPPFGPGFEHPVADAAMSLEPGQVTPVITAPGEDGDDHYVAICLGRVAGRNAPFAEVADEVWQGLMEKPLGPFEFNAYLLRFRGGTPVELPRGGLR